MPKLVEIFTYPIKSMPGIKSASATITFGEGLNNDRRFAITNGVSDTQNGAWLTSRTFFINAINEGLLNFSVTLSDQTLTLTAPERNNNSWLLGNRESLERANEGLANFVKSLNPPADVPAPVIVERSQVPGELAGFWDFYDSGISLMNMNSLRAIGDAMGEDLDIRRFRGNLIIDELPAWQEFGLIGKRIRVGETEFDILRPIKRCPATGVNPDTGLRDQKIPDALMNFYGHGFFGVYAKVIKPGEINSKDKIEVIGDAETTLIEAENPADSNYKLWPKFVEVVSHDQTTNGAELVIRSTNPWPLPEAEKSQRVRFHITKDLIGVAEVLGHENGATRLQICHSETSDPATTHLIEKIKTGNQLIVSGPFGRV